MKRMVFERDDYLGIALHVIAEFWTGLDPTMERSERYTLVDAFAVVFPGEIDDVDALMTRYASARIER